MLTKVQTDFTDEVRAMGWARKACFNAMMVATDLSNEPEVWTWGVLQDGATILLAVPPDQKKWTWYITRGWRPNEMWWLQADDRDAVRLGLTSADLKRSPILRLWWD